MSAPTWALSPSPFLCFEPNPDNYENLLHNIRVNGVQNVEAVNAGVWDGAGYLVNQPDPQNTGGNRVRAAGFEDDPDCLAYSFPEIRRKWGLARIRLLKMDCEGAEYHALRTASDVAGVDDLLLEVHGGDYANLVKLARTVPLHRIQILQDSHVVLDSAGAWKPTSLGAPA
jgi:FkbM family methyltransferase